MVIEPVLSLLALVFGVIVLLEEDIFWSLAIGLDTALKFILQNLGVKFPIHLPINLAGIPNPFPQHAAPHHQRPSSILLSPFHMPVPKALPCLFPYPLPAI